MLGRYREPVRGWIDPIGRVLYHRFRLRPNHLTVLGLGVSLLAATAFCWGRTRGAGWLLILAGLCDFFDGSLARASGQVSAFGAFLDSVIDRYSDLVVLLGIVVLFAQMPHARGAVGAMAGTAPRACGICANRTTIPSRTTRSEYRSMTESRNAPNADTCPDARASEPSKKSQRPARMSSHPAPRVRPQQNAVAASR